MACYASVLSLQRTPLTERAPAHFVLPESRRQARNMRAGALSEINVAQAVATTADLPVHVEVTDPAVYISLGLLLASFVGTFGVAPMFRSSFKEEETSDSPLVPEP